MDNLHVVDHPLVAHRTTLLRQADTDASSFRTVCKELTRFLTYEVLRQLPVEKTLLETPIASDQFPKLAEPLPAVVGILRAGLIMIDGFLEVVPDAPVGHVGVSRCHATHLPTEYYCNLPSSLADRQTIVVDPMLATGGSAIHALNLVAEAGCQQVQLVSIVGCPEGVEAVHAKHPNVMVTLAALDERLNTTPTSFPAWATLATACTERSGFKASDSKPSGSQADNNGVQMIDWETLRNAASEAAAKAYAPYSNFCVGAAGVTTDGRIVTGANVENVSYGLTLCAECSLVSDLIRTGGGRLKALAVASPEGEPIAPCGRCRQILLEHGGPDCLLFFEPEPLTVGQLLPNSFSAQNLRESNDGAVADEEQV